MFIGDFKFCSGWGGYGGGGIGMAIVPSHGYGGGIGYDSSIIGRTLICA